MAVPVQITFRDMPPSPAVSMHAEKRAQKLQQLFGRIVDCHVVVEEPHRRSRKGQKFHVRIDVRVPGRELVVSKIPEDTREDLYAALDDAFTDAERVVEDYARRLQPDAAAHTRPPHGTVAKIFHDRGYGFIASEGDGHEVYFHRNSILVGRFDRMGIGTRVRFAEEDGDQGPQASTVYVVGA
jgi:ribosomal subunit interface protein